MRPSTRSPPRLFVPAALAEGVEAMPSPAQAHYLARVLRRSPGDAVTLFNGADGEWHGRIGALGRISVVIAERRTRPQAAGMDCWLLFALVGHDATGLIVRAATELGVSDIRPVLTERAQRARSGTDRLTAIAIEAAEQSERLTVPRVRAPVPLGVALAECGDRAIFAAVERALFPAPDPAIATRPGGCGLLVGPEGGWAEAERALLLAGGVRPVSLGPNILRAETAVIAGLALLLLPLPTPRAGG